MQVCMLYYGRLFIRSGQMTTGKLVSFILYQSDLGHSIRVPHNPLWIVVSHDCKHLKVVTLKGGVSHNSIYFLSNSTNISRSTSRLICVCPKGNEPASQSATSRIHAHVQDKVKGEGRKRECEGTVNLAC